MAALAHKLPANGLYSELGITKVIAASLQQK